MSTAVILLLLPWEQAFPAVSGPIRLRAAATKRRTVPLTWVSRRRTVRRRAAGDVWRRVKVMLLGLLAVAASSVSEAAGERRLIRAVLVTGSWLVMG